MHPNFPTTTKPDTTSETDNLDQNSDNETIDEHDRDILYAISTEIQETIDVE